MPESSLQRHIIRCMVNYPKFHVCPYNALHRYRTEKELADHMFDCEAKNKAMFIELESNKTKFDISSQSIDNIRAFNLAHENWDED